MNLIEQILCAGVALTVGCGALVVGVQANKQVGTLTDMNTAMSIPAQQQEMLDAMAKAEAERMAKMAEQNRQANL